MTFDALGTALHELDEIGKEDIPVSVAESRDAVVDNAGVVVHGETFFPLLVVLVRALAALSFCSKTTETIKAALRPR